MKHVIKLFIVAVLVLVFTPCLAGELADEIKELNSIYAPIVKHFADGPGSPSERLRKAIISAEINESRQFSKPEVFTMVDQGDFNDGVDNSQFLDCTDALNQLKGTVDPSVYAIQHLKAWQLKTATCSIYATLVLIISEFNLINDMKQHKKPIYQMKSLVMTTPETGNHVFVLFEGNSKTVFVMDPWARKFTLLDNSFTIKLFGKKRNQTVELIDASKLNFKLFSKPYYDVFYVNHDTQWVVNGVRTEKISKMTHIHNKHMRDLYTELRPYFQWKYSYDELFATGSTTTQATTTPHTANSETKQNLAN